MPSKPTRPSKPQPPVPPDLDVSPVAEFYQTREGVDWRVDKWDFLKAEIPELERGELCDFHNLVRDSSPRAWVIIRRLFGFIPKYVPISGNPDDYRVLPKRELAVALQITDNELNAELEAIRLAWRRRKKLEQTAIEGAAKPITLPCVTEPSHTDEENDELLIRFSFDPEMFDLPTRDKHTNAVEKLWFCKRLREWEPLLTKSTMTEQLASDTLSNELRLRREKAALWAIDREPAAGIARERAKAERKKKAADRIKELQDAHREQLEAIREHAPWFNVSDAQISATGAIAQLIKGFHDWEARSDSRLLDGVFNSLELQVLVRTAKQIEEPRYRWGWVMYVNDSKQWLWDPNAKSMLRERDLARFDAGFKEGVKKFNETSDDHVVDLESDGSDGTYEDLVIQ